MVTNAVTEKNNTDYFNREFNTTLYVPFHFTSCLVPDFFSNVARNRESELIYERIVLPWILFWLHIYLRRQKCTDHFTRWKFFSKFLSH